MPVHRIKITKLLQSQMSFDSSDIIILATHLLSDNEKINPDLINQIKLSYAHYDYAEAFSLIHRAGTTLDDDGEFNQLIEGARAHSAQDNPKANTSRRYFETMLAQKIWTDFVASADVQASITKLSAFASSLNPELLANGIQVNDEHSMEDAIAILRDIGNNTAQINETESRLRDPEINPVSNYKDRGGAKDSEHPAHSMNPGILRSSDPMFMDQKLPEAKKKVVDKSRINPAKKQGYSRTNHHVAFVNSVSGTAYTMASILKHYMDAHSQDPTLQKDVNHMASAFVAFTCKQGFHSMPEMMDVLHSPEVTSLFAEHNVELTAMFTQEQVDSSFAQSEEYAAAYRKLSQINNEIRQKVREKSVADPEKQRQIKQQLQEKIAEKQRQSQASDEHVMDNDYDVSPPQQGYK